MSSGGVANSWILAVVCIPACLVVDGLNNGLALVPPMSYSVWFDGSATSSSGCMNDTMLRATADAMVANGLQAAGYDTFGLGEFASTKVPPVQKATCIAFRLLLDDRTRC